MNILFPGCSNGFRLLWSPTEVNFGASGITPLHGNFCSHGNILCASVCAVEDVIHHLQANMSQVRQTPQALVVILNSDILWVPSRNELFIQPCFSWPWNRGWKVFGPQSTRDNGQETSSCESSTCYSATPRPLAFAGVTCYSFSFYCSVFALKEMVAGTDAWCMFRHNFTVWGDNISFLTQGWENPRGLKAIEAKVTQGLGDHTGGNTFQQRNLSTRSQLKHSTCQKATNKA